MSDVVWWTKNGSKLHRSMDCPPMRDAILRASRALSEGAVSHADDIRSYDFATGSVVEGHYPPEHFELCDLCRDEHLGEKP